jgi:MoxR-like ATPase
VQSALLECMEERQITVDGYPHPMPQPFHVIATQNPIGYEGTFPLPETQLDRFLVRLSLGYPSIEDEVVIMERQQYGHPIEQICQVIEPADLVRLQQAVRPIYVDGLVKQYIAMVVEATRRHQSAYLGASPRGSLALFRTSQARALIQGRDYVLPDDIKALAEPVLAHRLIIQPGSGQHRGGRDIVEQILASVPVPGAIPSRVPRAAR